jgi:threonine dehydrogenase-like Zn-dependent dehydrogenase
MELEDVFRSDDDYFLGQEWVAEVLEVGPGTEDAPVAPGDRVVSVPYLVRDITLVPLGFSNDHYGGSCEQFLLSSALCRRVPNGLEDARAALTEPMAVGLHAVNQAHLEPGDSALVVGCGPIGLAIVAWLKARGVEPIIAADYSSARRALAATLGAQLVPDPTEVDPFEAARPVTAGRPLVVFEAVGVPGVLDYLVERVPPRSRIVVAGVCMQRDTIRPLLAVVKELNLQFVDEFDVALRALSEGDLEVAPLLTGWVGFDGVAGAFEALGAAEHVKILVEPNGPAILAAP